MNVLIVGSGNIGTTLAQTVATHREALGIDRIWILKNRLRPWQTADLEALRSRGIELCSREKVEGMTLLPEIEPLVDYVFDCAETGTGRKLKDYYNGLPRLRGACAQGSEKGFGIPFMTGINDVMIRGQRFVHIVSCNTHGTAAVIKALAGPTFEDLNSADIVVVRRCEDIGAHERLVTASVVARHLDPVIGTHHAIDVVDLWKTLGMAPKVTSSDVTTPSQLMHAARFHLHLKQPVTENEVVARFAASPTIGNTVKFDSNAVFEAGRRYGFQGRIYEHAVVVRSNLLVDGPEVRGWVFVAQEGNTILSTIDAFLLQTEAPHRAEAMREISRTLLRKEW